jgi:hypothetical protein
MPEWRQFVNSVRLNCFADKNWFFRRVSLLNLQLVEHFRLVDAPLALIADDSQQRPSANDTG